MAIELMDGRTGENHISSEDWATFNVATYGVTEGVFDWGDGFGLSMSTSNKGTLASGAGLVDGKRVWVRTPESVTIESGGQGVKRHDVVGIQYETHGADLERAVVKVVKGTAAASPKDPELPAKFLPLWRVPLDGITVGTPVALFDKMPTVDCLRDSISPQRIDGWLLFDRGSGVFEAFRAIDVEVSGGGEQHAKVNLPVKAKSSEFASVAKRTNGWLISGAPYVHSSTSTALDVVYWGNGDDASGTVGLQLHAVGERA